MPSPTFLRSVGSNPVRVRIPPSAPIQNQIVTGVSDLLRTARFLCFVCPYRVSLAKQQVFDALPFSMTRTLLGRQKTPQGTSQNSSGLTILFLDVYFGLMTITESR